MAANRTRKVHFMLEFEIPADPDFGVVADRSAAEALAVKAAQVFASHVNDNPDEWHGIRFCGGDWRIQILSDD